MGRRLEFRIPRDRYGEFHPKILAILRDQEDECERFAGSLYTKGLTQEQVGEVFENVYGDRYSKSSISRMVECVRREVGEWLGRGLERYYPVLFVDCIQVKGRRVDSVGSEAFYVALAVTSEGRREVLGVSNIPADSAAGWGLVFDGLKGRRSGRANKEFGRARVRLNRKRMRDFATQIPAARLILAQLNLLNISGFAHSKFGSRTRSGCRVIAELACLKFALETRDAHQFRVRSALAASLKKTRENFLENRLRHAEIFAAKSMRGQVRTARRLPSLTQVFREVFATGQRGYTVETAWANWRAMCCRWEKRYAFFKRLRSDPDYKAYMNLNFAPGIQRMVYTTNWVERLNRDFRRVLRMRTAMPSGDSVITPVGSVAMNRRATGRLLPNTTSDGKLFPRAELGREFGEEF